MKTETKTYRKSTLFQQVASIEDSLWKVATKCVTMMKCTQPGDFECAARTRRRKQEYFWLQNIDDIDCPGKQGRPLQYNS